MSSSFSGKIFTHCGDFGRLPTLAAFGICTNGNNYVYTKFDGVIKSFPSCSNMCYFSSSKIEEQKEIIDETINVFIKDFKEKLYEYYNIEK